VLGLLAASLLASAAGAGKSNSAGRPVDFLTGPTVGRPLTIALAYLSSHRGDFGLAAPDLSDLAVSDQYTDKASGTTHIYLQQRYEGIDVFDGITDVNVARDGSVINVGDRFVSDLAGKVGAATPPRGVGQGVQDAARGLGLGLGQAPQVVHVKGGSAQETLFNRAGISLRPIPARLVWVPTASGVRLAWNVTIDQTDGEHWWSANVDAATGALLSKVDYTASSDSYDVVPPPHESPPDGGRSLVTDPADPVASPFGWLDTNGIAGADTTITDGNNVHAGIDLNGDGVADPGSEADGGTNLLFDFTLDLTQQPTAYEPAAVTNLFFWNNYMHDVSYHYGFTEAAGNFQQNNYGRGGSGGDSVTANDLTGYTFGVRNNSNFGTPPDGQPPRMNMYAWTPPAASLIVNTPAGIAGTYTTSLGSWGTQSMTGDIELPSGSSLGCDASDFSSFTPGEIALVDRGTCTFSTKIRNAQAVGASAVIVPNSAPGVFAMPTDGTPNQPTITAVMVSQADGATIRANLPVNATIDTTPGPERDGSLDSTIIAHEYTHGISNRLTGGPSNTACLSNAEQPGEGWSDFIALAVTANASQTATTPRLMGAYATSGAGFRDFPYTTDMSVNPQTYDSIKSNGDTHFVGAVWTSMMWEMYWKLVGTYGFDPNLFDSYTSGGNNLAVQLVMDGLKLQPCNPGFVDARDAILLADQQDTGGANQCLIWQAFAKRGLGASASQGDPNSSSDGTQDFTVPSACSQTDPASLSSIVLPGGSATQTLDIRNPGLVVGNDLNWTISEAADNCSAPSHLGWVSETPASGTTSNGSSTAVAVIFDATGLAQGQYSGLLCLSSDDPAYPSASIPLSLTVPQVLSGKIAKSLTVASGQFVYLAPGTVVGGSVTVKAGGSLWVGAATIGGSLSSSGAGLIRLCGSTVKGSVSVAQTSGIVVFGDDDGATACAGNTIGSKAVITNNLGGVEFIGNTVKGPLTITGNTGTLPPPDTGTLDVAENTVKGQVTIQP
jgi:extracellular elastinolytic metalloproteinase